MSAVAIDNAALPPICPSGAPPSAPSSDDGFRKALTSETDKTASEPLPSEHGADDAKPAATDQPTSPKNDASDRRDSQGRDAVATNGSATEPATADAGQVPAQPAVAQEDAAALLVILAQLMAAQTPVQPQMAAAGKAGVTTAKTAAAAAASPPKDSKNKATDQTAATADGKSKSEPDAAQTLVAAVVPPVQSAPPAAVAVAPSPQPAADAPKSATSASVPSLSAVSEKTTVSEKTAISEKTTVSENTTAPSAQDLLAAVDPNQSGSADPQPAQVPTPNPADDFAAQIPAADRPRDDSSRATATDANAAGPMPQVQRNDAPPPMEHLRVETRPFAAEPALQQLAIHVTRAVKDGLDQFDIDLKPDTLGRVTVRLEFGSESKVHAVFAAERPETLALLRRDAHEIARAFNDAGVRADAGSLSFSLNGHGGQSDRQVFTGQPILFPAADSATEAATMTAPATYSRAGGIDIRI